jgi:DNA polymerase III subunit epsilon
LPFDFAAPSLLAAPGADAEPAAPKRRRGRTSGPAKPGDASARAAALVETMVPAPPAVALPASPPPTAAAPVLTLVPAAISAAPSAQAASQLRVMVFDVETTGTDRRQDQVIELGVQRGLGAEPECRTWRFCPDVPIHPGAQAVHGIAMADLEGCPRFADCLDEIAAAFHEVDVIIGYNIAFDIDMLAAEFERAGRPPLDFSSKAIVDAFRLWQQCEPRSLQHAHQRFVGDRFTAAHSASADVAATGRVLTGMLRAFGLEEQDWGVIAGLCDPQRATWIGPTRHLRWDGGVVVLGFGKHAGAPLHKLALGPDRGFLRWVLDRDFPSHVVEVCRATLELCARLSGDAVEAAAEHVAAWVRGRFGPPAAPALGAAVGGASG